MPSAFDPFPFTVCEEHGRQCAYFVCVHVIDGARPVRVVWASETKPGVILCPLDHTDPDTCRVSCARHCGRYLARYRGNT